MGNVSKSETTLKDQVRQQVAFHGPTRSTTTAQADDQLNPRFKGVDIGDVGETGSTAFDDKTSKYTVAGSSGDIFGENDQFHYAYVAWSGDGQIVARVTDVTDTNGNAKAGVMFRNR